MSHFPEEKIPHTQPQYRLVETLSCSKNQHQNLLDHISAIVFTLDTNLAFSFLNKAWQLHTGHEINICIGQPFQSFVADSDYQRLMQLLSETATPIQLKINLACSDGVTRWFQMNLNQETYQQTRCYSGTLINIQDNQEVTPAINKCEPLFKTVVETISEILFQLDKHYHITFINPAWSHITGFSAAETLGKPLLEFIHPEDHHYYYTQIINYIDQNTPELHLEFRLTSIRGSLIWISMRAQKNLSPTSTEGWFLTGVMLNITERVDMEKTLHESKERYALLAASTTDGIWDWDIKTNKVYLSPRWKSMLGYEDHEIENCFSSWHKRIHPDDLKITINTVLSRLKGTRSSFENIHRLKHKDGSWRWILDRGMVERHPSGLPYRMLGSHTDMTLLKKAEQELDAIVSISPDGIVTVTKQGFIQSVNPAFLSMTGLKTGKLIGLSEQAFNDALESICDKNSSYSSSNVEKQPVNQKTYIIDFNNSPTNKLKPKKIWILIRTDRQLNNETIDKVLYFRDATVETEIAKMKSEFLVTAAHELRTPMASVFGFSELLLSRQFDSETTQEILSTIHQQSANLVQILNELLDLARIESLAGMDFVFTNQSLLGIIDQAINSLLVPGDTRIIKRRKLKNDYLVLADADKLRQVITNVLSNAYKYSTTGDIELSLKQRKKHAQAEVGIMIRDQGIGMNKDQLQHVFTRFWRANNIADIPGTGLGMSIVKEIMEFHYGQVEITSKPGIGTTVILWLKQAQKKI